MPSPQPRVPLTVALLCAVLAGAAFGASSALLPFVKLNLIVLIGALVVLFTVFARSRRGGLLLFLASLIAGGLAASAMWLVWFGLELGFDRLAGILSQGPKAITQTVQSLTNMSRTVTLSSNTFTHSAREVTTLWLIETALIAGAPVLGALLLLRRNRYAVTL